ncbi:MAG: hypothetical protein HOV94_34550 [Saccharothrix sp.]|nr:hypothetical protein [Saccharothrix sp.]
MSTALLAVGSVAGVAGALAMYLPAHLARLDAITYRDLAEKKLDECEARDAAYEASRELQPFWSFDAPAELPAAEHEGEVLHVDHPTGEQPAIPKREHTPACPDLYYCPTVGEVESGCHGRFDVCCAAPELHRPMTEQEHDALALSDRPAEDEDAWGEEQPGEAWFAGLVERWRRLVAWFRSLGASRRERHLIGSGEQATADDPFAELLAHVETDAEERRVEIEAWVERAGRHGSGEVAQDTGYRGSRWAAGIEHTGVHPIVIPAPREAGDDL